VGVSRGDYLPDLSAPFDMSNLSLSGMLVFILHEPKSEFTVSAVGNKMMFR